MSTRMERMESGPSKRHRQCANMRERIRDGLDKGVMAHNAKVMKSGKGTWGGRVDSIYVSTECITVIGDRIACDLAADLLRKGGLKDVTVMLGVGESWTATGVI